MKNPMFVSKGGVGYGVDESQKVTDDGKGWVWLAAETSPGGLAVELFKSVPYGKRALLVAPAANVDEAFSKMNWDAVLANVEKTLGGPQIKQRRVMSAQGGRSVLESWARHCFNLGFRSGFKTPNCMFASH